MARELEAGANGDLFRDSEGAKTAVQIYNDAQPASKVVSELAHDVGYNKNNIMLNVTDLPSCTMSMLDAMYFIVSKTDGPRREYAVPEACLKFLMNYGGSRAHLQTMIDQLMGYILTGKKEKDNPDTDFEKYQLLGPTSIINRMVTFKVDETLQKKIQVPYKYHYFSLRNSLPSAAAKIVYGRLQADLSKGVTDYIELDEFRAWHSQDPDWYKEFRDLKRHAINKAVDEINAYTDMTVSAELMPAPGTKKIKWIRFKFVVQEGKKTHLTAMDARWKYWNILDSEFGVTQSEIERVLKAESGYSDEQIENAITYTQYKAKRKEILKGAGGAFMYALTKARKIGSLDLAAHIGEYGPDHGLSFIDGIDISSSLVESVKTIQEQIANDPQELQDVYTAFLAKSEREKTISWNLFVLAPAGRDIFNNTLISIRDGLEKLNVHQYIRLSFCNFLIESEKKVTESAGERKLSANLFTRPPKTRKSLLSMTDVDVT